MKLKLRIKFHMLDELEQLLLETSQEKREELGKIIDTPFENEPRLLCDHINYLYRSGFGQILSRLVFHKRPTYKQLVTDIVDEIDRNIWQTLPRWEDATTEQIEAALVNYISSNAVDLQESKPSIPKEVKDTVTNVLIAFTSAAQPQGAVFIVAGKPVIASGVNSLFDLQKTPHWGKLVAGIIYIHTNIR